MCWQVAPRTVYVPYVWLKNLKGKIFEDKISMFVIDLWKQRNF